MPMPSCGFVLRTPGVAICGSMRESSSRASSECPSWSPAVVHRLHQVLPCPLVTLEVAGVDQPEHQLDLLDLLEVGVMPQELLVRLGSLRVELLAGELVGDVELRLPRQHLLRVEPAN